jgi:hypothetical protein
VHPLPAVPVGTTTADWRAIVSIIVSLNQTDQDLAQEQRISRLTLNDVQNSMSKVAVRRDKPVKAF